MRDFETDFQVDFDYLYPVVDVLGCYTGDVFDAQAFEMMSKEECERWVVAAWDMKPPEWLRTILSPRAVGVFAPIQALDDQRPGNGGSGDVIFRADHYEEYIRTRCEGLEEDEEPPTFFPRLAGIAMTDQDHPALDEFRLHQGRHHPEVNHFGKYTGHVVERYAGSPEYVAVRWDAEQGIIVGDHNSKEGAIL